MIARLRALAASALGQSSPLVIARLCSAALTFGLPLVLVRLLEPDAFGTYKQFFLVGQTLLLVGQLGLTQSLYYFLPRGGDERGSYLAHTLTALAVLGALFGAALWLLAPWIGGRLGSGELAHLRWPLAVYSAAMLAAAPLEGALTSEGRIGKAAIAYVATDAARTAALIGAARLVGPRAIFWAAAAVAIGRVCALATLVARRVLPTARPRGSLLRAQLAFALPFAGASWLYVGQRYFSQYAVSARFDAATFALFAVASFHMPVVDIVFTPITEVLMVRLGRALGRGERAAVLAEWDDAVGKLASILFPAAIGAWLLGPTVLPLLFTKKYVAAVPLFMLATIEIPLSVVPVDGLLRAVGDTRFLFVFSAGRVVLTATLVLGGIATFGLRGAIGGALVSEAVCRAAMLWRGCRFLGVAPARALDWTLLGRTAAAALGAALPAAGVRFALAPGVRMVVATMAVYGASYVALRLALVGRPRAERAERAGLRAAPAT
jgi:O-antigen/teichoic acid export membrane protein